MVDRQQRLLSLIEQATGKGAYKEGLYENGIYAEVDEDTIEAEMTIAT